MNKTSSKLAAGVRKVKSVQADTATVAPARQDEKTRTAKAAAPAAPPRKQPSRVWPD